MWWADGLGTPLFRHDADPQSWLSKEPLQTSPWALMPPPSSIPSGSLVTQGSHVDAGKHPCF